MSSLPQPPPVSLGSAGVHRHRGDTPRLCSQGLGGSPLPRLLIAQRLQQELAQCSGSLRTGSRGNRNEIILSKGRQRNVKFSPRASLLSVGIMLMTTKNRAGGEARPFHAAAPFLTPCWRAAEPAPASLAHSGAALHSCEACAAVRARCGEESNFPCRMCQCMCGTPAGRRETHAPRDIGTQRVLMHTPSASV